MNMRLWQMNHISGIWNPTPVCYTTVFPESKPPEPVDPEKENVWVPDGFAPPGWEDTRLKSVLAVMLNDPVIVGGHQYAFTPEESQASLKANFPNGAALVWDELTNADGVRQRVVRLVTPEEAQRLEAEKTTN